jgi:hypothetical protein
VSLVGACSQHKKRILDNPEPYFFSPSKGGSNDTWMKLPAIKIKLDRLSKKGSAKVALLNAASVVRTDHMPSSGRHRS